MKLLNQVLSKLGRDRERLPPNVLLRKALRYAEGLALSSLYLRYCTSVGARARVRGKPFIENLGKIVIGDDFNFVSLFVQSHLVTGHEGVLDIGNSVNINFGAAISAHERVQIGDRVRIGPYSIIMDSDYHSANNRNLRPSAPIVIEEDVWLAGRVSVLKGSRIGKGSVITAGSVVSGNIPSGVVAGGVPARVLRAINPEDPSALGWAALEDPSVFTPPQGSGQGFGGSQVGLTSQAKAFPEREASSDELPPPSEARPRGVEAAATSEGNSDELEPEIAEVISTTFGLSGPVQMAWGMRDIPKWDSLGQLRLVMALEERFNINIPEQQLVQMNSVSRVRDVVRACTRR